MPRAINKANKYTPAATIAAVRAHMNNLRLVNFENLRANVPALADLPDNEIKQAILDADLEYDESDDEEN